MKVVRSRRVESWVKLLMVTKCSAMRPRTKLDILFPSNSHASKIFSVLPMYTCHFSFINCPYFPCASYEIDSVCFANPQPYHYSCSQAAYFSFTLLTFSTILRCASDEFEIADHEMNYWFLLCRPAGPEDVTFKILYCGVCHSDLHQILNEWQNSIYPMVPG